MKSFKCEIEMQWVSFDECCPDHRFENEDDPAPKTSKSASEAIDLGRIPITIRPENSSKLQETPEVPASVQE